MPSSVNMVGLRLYRPGIYAQVDASALGGSGGSTGNVAVVGPFPGLQHDTPLTFTSPRAVGDYDPTDLDMQLVAKLAFQPSTDDRVPGGAASLTFVNIQDVTQAVITLMDSAGAGSLKLKSKLWGKKGNQTLVSVKTNLLDTNAVDVVLKRGGQTETYDAVQSGKLCSIYYDGDDLTATTCTASPTQLKVDWEMTLQSASASFEKVLDSLVINGVLKCDPIATDPPGANFDDVTYTVEGVTTAGEAKTVAHVLELPGNTSNPDEFTIQDNGADVQWKSISKITITQSAGPTDITHKYTGTAYDFDTADYTYLGEMVGLIDNDSAKGFHAEQIHPRLNSIPATSFDAVSGDCFSSGAATAKIEPRGDLWELYNKLAVSQLVTAELVTGATKPPKQFGAALNGDNTAGTLDMQEFFTGGTNGAFSDADYDGALASIEYADVQIVVGMSDSVVVHKKLSQHCVNSAIAGYERNAWCGTSTNQSLANVFSNFTSKINSRYVSVVAQQAQVENALGKLEYVEPKYLAVMMAGMQAGTPVATPLTWKRPSVFATKQLWDINRDANEAISKGLVNVSSDNLGLKIERSVTSYMEDDNPIYSETSAFESVQTSVRDLRAALLIKIGNPVYGATANKMRGIVETRLNDQIRAGFIKTWRNVILEDLGDTIKISYEVAAVEPLNFILVTASVVRISTAS